MKTFIATFLLVFSTQLLANQLCTVHIDNEGLSKTQLKTVRIKIKALNFIEVKATDRANYKIVLKKESYFNPYGMPAFFMRQYNLDLYENDRLIYETYHSGVFPAFKSLKKLLVNLEEDITFCPNPNPIDLWD